MKTRKQIIAFLSKANPNWKSFDKQQQENLIKFNEAIEKLPFAINASSKKKSVPCIIIS